jgi:hypothetical protein
MARIDTTTQPIEITISQENFQVINGDEQQSANWIRMKLAIALEPEDSPDDPDREVFENQAILMQFKRLSDLVILMIQGHKQNLELSIYEANASEGAEI